MEWRYAQVVNFRCKYACIAWWVAVRSDDSCWAGKGRADCPLTIESTMGMYQNPCIQNRSSEVSRALDQFANWRVDGGLTARAVVHSHHAWAVAKHLGPAQTQLRCLGQEGANKVWPSVSLRWEWLLPRKAAWKTQEGNVALCVSIESWVQMARAGVMQADQDEKPAAHAGHATSPCCERAVKPRQGPRLSENAGRVSEEKGQALSLDPWSLPANCFF